MLRIPGPTTCPPEVLDAMAKQMIGLDDDELSEALRFAGKGIKDLLFSQDIDVCLLSASGTGAMEAAIVNFLSPGDKVLICSCGVFGERFVGIALAYGLKVQLLTRPYGYGFKPDDFKLEFVKMRKILGDFDAVFFTHNETSTGVTNPIEMLAEIVRNNSGAVIIVDAVSSFAISPLKMRDWKIDVVVGGVQKGLMTPPALSFVAFSAYAKLAMRRSTMPRFYFDLWKYTEATARSQTPFTPAIPQLRALKEAISLIYEEGMAVYERHQKFALMLRIRIKELGLEVFAKECFSDGITAVKVPDGLKVGDIIRVMRGDYGITIAGGPGELAGKILRIGHMGYFGSWDIDKLFFALESTLIKLRNCQKTLVK